VTTTTATRTYKIDKSHSEAIFQVRHLVTKVRGRFTDFEGAIEFNEANPEQFVELFKASHLGQMKQFEFLAGLIEKENLVVQSGGTQLKSRLAAKEDSGSMSSTPR